MAVAVSGNDGSRLRGRRNHITKLDMNFVYYFPLLISRAHKCINLIRTASPPILLRHSLILGAAAIPFTMFYTQVANAVTHKVCVCAQDYCSYSVCQTNYGVRI